MSTLAAAAACVAFLMDAAAPPLPYHYVPRKPGYALCAWASRGLPDPDKGCNAVFRIDRSTGAATIVGIDDFGTLTHELCHVQQHLEGRFLTTTPVVREAECIAVRSRAGECFQGLGAPGMDGSGMPGAGTPD